MSNIIGTEVVGKAQNMAAFTDELNNITTRSKVNLMQLNNERGEHFTFIESSMNLWDITFENEVNECKIEHKAVDFRFLRGYLYAATIIDNNPEPTYTFHY